VRSFGKKYCLVRGLCFDRSETIWRSEQHRNRVSWVAKVNSPLIKITLAKVIFGEIRRIIFWAT